MSFFRLIKPDWAKPKLANDEANPRFVEEVEGPDTIEGNGYTGDFLTEKNQIGYNIYFFPNHPSTDVYAAGVRHLNGKHIDVFNFLFVDMDLKDEVYASKEAFLEELSRFPIKPTMVVDSGHGIHAYWKVLDLTRDSYVNGQLSLLNHFKTDDSVYTVLQLMRCPGFDNTKVHGQFIPAYVLEDHSSGEPYLLEQITQVLPEISEELKIKAQNHINKLDGKLKIELPTFVNIDELPDKFIDLLYSAEHVNLYNLFMNPTELYGDRSAADMKLTHELKKAGFNKKEALAVISNTEKATSKGTSRYAYAEITVDKAYTDKLNSEFLTVGQKLRSNNNEVVLGELVNGTYYFDSSVLGNPWRKGELLGLIAGAGVGKTSVTLKWMKDSIENNPDNDDVFIFFSLEMGEQEIINRWVNLVGSNSPLADRLYVIGNEDAERNPRNIGLQEILEISNKIKQGSGKELRMVAIDHIGIVSKHIDIRKKHTFDIQSEERSGNGNIRTLSLNRLANQLKVLNKLLDTFIVVLTQTTKDKGKGDIPIAKDGAYGISNYENIMDRIITVWQPLMLVQNLVPVRFLAWQYVKIRSKHVNDNIGTDDPKLLTFDLGSGDLRISNDEEHQIFTRFLPLAQEERDKLNKKKTNNYAIQSDIQNIIAAVKTKKDPGNEMGKV